MVPKGVVEQAKVLVNKHAAQAHEMLEGIENNIAGIGRQLDELRAARDILTGALQGTEKLRAELRDDGSASAPESDPFE
jgi:hypothetical protein